MKPPAAAATQFGRLARSVDGVPPLHLLAGIGAVLVGLTLMTPFAFKTLCDNAYIALTILAGLLALLPTRVGGRASVARSFHKAPAPRNEPAGHARNRLSLASASPVGDRQRRPCRRAAGCADAAGPLDCADRPCAPRSRRDRAFGAGQTIRGAGAG